MDVDESFLVPSMALTARQMSAHDNNKCEHQVNGSTASTKCRCASEQRLIDDTVPTVQLSNGVHMPLLGTGSTHSGGYSHNAMVYALRECGYRMIDTAKRYGTELLVAQSIADSDVPREQIFISTKLWPMDFGYARTIDACKMSCKRLKTNYIDLYLVHFPQVPDQLAKSAEGKVQLQKETWRAMEWLYENGFCRAIGVSNYNQDELTQLLAYARIPPHVNQVEFHPYYNTPELVNFCRSQGIVVAGYCPLAKGRILSEEPIVRIANKHQRTPAQICVRWSIDNGVPAIPKSTTCERMRGNAQVFDFHLDDEDLNVLNSLHDEQRKVIRWDDLQHKFDLPDGYKLRKVTPTVMKPEDA